MNQAKCVQLQYLTLIRALDNFAASLATRRASARPVLRMRPLDGIARVLQRGRHSVGSERNLEGRHTEGADRSATSGRQVGRHALQDVEAAGEPRIDGYWPRN